MSSVKSESLTSLPIRMPFFLFRNVAGKARTTTILPNESVEGGHPVVFLTLREKLQVFPNEEHVPSLGRLYMGFMIIEVFFPVCVPSRRFSS